LLAEFTDVFGTKSDAGVLWVKWIDVVVERTPLSWGTRSGLVT
jgi:hypothetical protein